MKKQKPANIVFDLFSTDELMRHICGAAMPELVANMTQESPTNIRRWMEKGFPSEDRFEKFIDMFPEEAREHIKAVKDGNMAYPSPLGSYLSPALEEDWVQHKATLARLFRTAHLDLQISQFADHYPLASLVQCLWGIPLNDEDKVPAKESTPPANTPAELIAEANQDRATIVRMNFFSTLASLDLEICRRLFPDHQPLMIFLTLLPSIRKRKGMPRHIVTPERKLADFLYCSIMDADYPPRVDDMLRLNSKDSPPQVWNSVALLKDRFKDGAVEWPDFNRLLNAWTTLLPPERGKIDHRSPSEWAILNLCKPECDFLRLMFAAMKAFSFAFKRAHGRKSEAQLNAFRTAYIDAWHGRVRFHGIELEKGKPWEETRLQRIIFDAQETSAIA